MSYDGPTPTKFGQYRVAEPLHYDRLHLHAEDAPLKEVSWTIPIGVLDQEDLLAQGIRVSQFIKGAKDVDALGSCTANASMASLSQHLVAAGKDLAVAGLGSNPVANETRAITFYHATTDRTGDPAQEFPPNDPGSTGLYCCQELISEKLISDYKTATGVVQLLSLLQTGSAIQGTPFFYMWMQPDADGFVDGDGSMDALEAAVESGVAGGHETCPYAIPQLAWNKNGTIDLVNTVVEVRNSWSQSWGLNGNFRLHASTLQFLSSYVDYKQFVV